MDQASFLRQLARDQFPAPVLVRRDPGGRLDIHSHDFEVKAMVLEGEITLEVDGRSQRFGPGEVFCLPAQQPHAERYGAAGVVYLAGRKALPSSTETSPT